MSPLRVLILSGPTREYLDPVRYLSNASSGLQGIAFAEEALELGCEVEVIQGPVALRPPPEAKVFDVVSAADMLEKALERHAYCDVLIGAAAVSDFRPRSIAEEKQKREGEVWVLELVPTTDILAALGPRKGLRIHVGFALETQNPRENALRKLVTKSLDWIVLNSPHAIGAPQSEYELLGREGAHLKLGRLQKRELAHCVFRQVLKDEHRIRIRR